MATIPEVRARIRQIAEALSDMGNPACSALAGMLWQCHDDLFRRPPNRIAPTKHIRLTDEQRRQIAHLASTTDLSQLEIANIVGTNPGRVSETLRGTRK